MSNQSGCNSHNLASPVIHRHTTHGIRTSMGVLHDKYVYIIFITAKCSNNSHKNNNPKKRNALERKKNSNRSIPLWFDIEISMEINMWYAYGYAVESGFFILNAFFVVPFLHRRTLLFAHFAYFRTLIEAVCWLISICLNLVLDFNHPLFVVNNYLQTSIVQVWSNRMTDCG